MSNTPSTRPSRYSGITKSLVAILLVVVGLYLLIFGASVQYCSVCELPYCTANTGATIGCNTQYFVSPLQTLVFMEPVVAHWNYLLNLFGLLVLSSGLFLGMRQRNEIAIESGAVMHTSFERKLAGTAIILFGIYLVYSWLTGASSLPQPAAYTYLTWSVGALSIGFGLFLVISTKPLLEG